MPPQITLEQWRTLIAVVDAGGYAQAAEILHKSQSAVTYSVQKIESLLNVKAFEIQGRKAQLTPTGQMLYRREALRRRLGHEQPRRGEHHSDRSPMGRNRRRPCRHPEAHAGGEAPD